jgi:hypothetical protein
MYDRERWLSPVVDVATGSLKSFELSNTSTICRLHLVGMIVGLMAFRRHVGEVFGLFDQKEVS